MAADSDGLEGGGRGVAGGGSCGGSCGVVVTCEGDLRDPRFPARLRRLLRELRQLLAEPHPHTLKVNKVEPWNSVRVTLSVPRAAAARLRALAAAGAPQLRALGILSVQLDGDAAVSLRLPHGAELRIHTDPQTPATDTNEASTSRQPSAEILAGLGSIGRLISESSGASTSGAPSPAAEAPREDFKSPNTVCPRDGKIPQSIPAPSTDRREFPFGSMTQARVIHRKENTLGLTAGASTSTRPTEATFARPSTSSFPAPPPYPAGTATQGTSAPGVAISSPLLVNLLQNDAPAPSPRPKPAPHPAKLDRLDDGQVELTVGRAGTSFEYRLPRAAPSPSPAPSPRPPAPRPPPPRPALVRRALPTPAPQQYRHATATQPNLARRFPSPFGESFGLPPPYRGAAGPAGVAGPAGSAVRPRPPPPQPQRISTDDLTALLPPPTTSMDQKTQSSFQEFQRYQQQYNARQRAASRAAGDWPEASLGLNLPELPDNCDLDQLLPTLGADLNLDEISADLEAHAKLDLLYDQNSTDQTPDSLLQEITGLANTINGPYDSTRVPSNDSSEIMPPPPVPVQSTSKSFQTMGPSSSNSSFKSPPNATYSNMNSVNSQTSQVSQASQGNQSAHMNQTGQTTHLIQANQVSHMGQASPAHMSPASQASHMNQTSQASHMNQTSQVSHMNQTSQATHVHQVSQASHMNQASNLSQASQMSHMSQASQVSHMSQASQVSHLSQASQVSHMNQASQVSHMSQASQVSHMGQVSHMSQASNSMPPPMRLPIRAAGSVHTATVGSQATAQEIEEQSKQYLIKTLMRDDDVPPKEEKKIEEVTVAQCKLKESLSDAPTTPEVFGIAKSTIEDDGKKSDDDKKKPVKRDDKSLAQKGGKPRTGGAKEKPATLKDKIVRDVKTKVALSRPPVAKPATLTEAPKSPGEKESIKLRLKLDKNEPVVQPVYKADVSFINQPPKGDKPTEGELRVPPLHISLRGRNSAIIKNSKKEKKKFVSDLHKKIKIRKTSETDDKSHRRDDDTIPSKSSESDTKTDDYLHVKSIKLNNHYNEGETIKTEITGDNNVVYRMKTISKNAHIVTKSEYKLNNKVSTLDKLKKKKFLNDTKTEKDKDWRNDVLDKEGKYAQNEGYRETNNHEAKKKVPLKDVKCDKSSEGKTVQSEESVGASEVRCNERTLDEGDPGSMERKASEGDNKLKRTAEAVTSPNGLLASEKKRKTSHSSLPDPPGSTNVGTIARLESPPGASAQRAGGTSPRRRERPKDKSYCKLVAERAARPDDKFTRSPSQAQGEDSGIESMDALSEKSPNQASQSPPGPQRKERIDTRLDMPRSTSPTSVQRIIGVIDQPPPSDELLERLSLATGQSHYDPGPPDIDDMGDIEAELAKMHADHINGDDAPRRPPDETKDNRELSPILRNEKSIDRVEDEKSDSKEESQKEKEEPVSPKQEKEDFDLPSRVSPPLYTYSNQEKSNANDAEAKAEKAVVSENGDMKSEKSEEKVEPKIERLPLKADFPDKSLLEQLLIEIPTPDYVSKRPESPSPSALERVARSSVRTRSSSKMNSPADGPKTPRLSPGINKLESRSDSPLQPRNCLRSGSVDKTSPKTNAVNAVPPLKPVPGAKRKRRESESSCASTISCEEGLSPAGRQKKKPRRVDGKPLGNPALMKVKKDSDSDSDEPLICKVRGKVKGGVKIAGKGEAVGTRRSGRAPQPPAPPAPAHQPAPPPRRKTRSAVGEGATPVPGAVRRRRASRDGK